MDSALLRRRPQLTGDPDQAKQFVKVCKLRKSLEKQKAGLYDTYTGVRVSPDSFYLKTDEQRRARGNLTFDFFCTQLKAGLCTVLLDGLDEAPDRISRQRLSKIIENAREPTGSVASWSPAALPATPAKSVCRVLSNASDQPPVGRGG